MSKLSLIPLLQAGGVCEERAWRVLEAVFQYGSGGGERGRELFRLYKYTDSWARSDPLRLTILTYLTFSLSYLSYLALTEVSNRIFHPYFSIARPAAWDCSSKNKLCVILCTFNKTRLYPRHRGNLSLLLCDVTDHAKLFCKSIHILRVFFLPKN